MKRMTALFAAAMGFAAVALADNETVNGINWTYRIVAGSEAQIYANNNVCIDTSTSGEITVPSTLGGKPVTKIGVRAFQGCTKLTKITIPSSVVFIDTYAFYNCTGLTEVVVPDSVSNCGTGDWFDCDNGKTLKLQKLTIPAAAAAVDLFGSTAIPSGLEVKTKVTSGGKTFAVKCSNLGKDSNRFALIGHGDSAAIDTATSGSVAVPGSVTVLGKSCTVKFIAERAFDHCTGVTGVTLPESVKWIETGAFSHCTAMTSISMPGVTSIGTLAFWNCDALTRVNLPSKLSIIGDKAFQSCDSLNSVVIRRGATSIGAGAFRSCGKLAELTIGEGTVEIGANAFYNCKMLGGVTLPATVAQLAHDAFNGCDGLWFAALPKHFYSGSLALPRSEFALIFSNCHPDLEIVFMENGVAAGISLLNDRFWYYRIYDSGSGKVVLLQNNGPNNLAVSPTPTGVLTIPSKLATRSVTDIGAQAFYGCTGLTGVNFPSGLKTIGNYAFYGCNRLSSVEIPNGVTSIGKGAFEDCSALENLIIPDGLAGWSSIGDDAFKNCTRLSLVRAPGALWNWPVGSSAPLTRVFPGHTYLFTNKSFYYVFDSYFQQWGDDSNIWKFTIVNGTSAKIVGASGLATKTVPVQLGGCPVSRIGEGAFKGSTSTKNFIIPANCNVTRIDDSAFENSGITNIDIRSSVTYLGTAVFKGCAALETATLPGTVTELPMDAFYGCANLAWVEATPDEIGDFAFYDCPALDSSAVNYIISYAETIGTAAFACLEPAVRTGQLEVPDDTTSIGDYAFSAAGFTGGASLPGALAGAIDESTVFYGWTSSMPIIYRFANGVFAETVDSIVWRYTVDAYGNATLVGATMQAGTLYTGAFPSVLGGHPVTAIAAGAFENDTVLRYVTIPASVTTIGANAFKGANANPLTSKLRDIRIQGGVTNICANAFAYTELGRGGAQLYIPDSVRSIDTGAFSHCPYLARVSLPERFYPDRARMTSDVFAGCSSDLQITYRVTGGDVMSQTINGTTWYIEKSGDTVKLRGMEVRNVPTGVLPAADPRPEGALVIPDKVCGYTVNTIGSWAFGYCNLISSVTIPDTITKIEENAFYGCGCLESVSIPRSVTTIEDYAFDQCFGLATANLPDTLLGRIDESKVFRGCAEVVAGGIAVNYFGEGEVRGVNYNGMSWTYRVLDEALHTAKLVPYNGNPAVTPAPTSTLTIPSTLGGYTIVEIGEKSFDGCSGLTGVVLPSTVTTIGKNAFSDTGLTAVTLPSSVETIKEYAFFRCPSLASASFTSGLTRIERYAFCNCSSLGNVDLPASLTYIGDHAFDNCDSFTEFAIPANVLYLGEESLYGCRAITNLYVASQAIFDESSMVMYNAFGSDRQLVTLSVTLAPGITTIPQGAFEGFEKMASVSIPDTVTKIEKYAFWECKALTEVVIPDSVTEFEEGVFLSCINLERVTLPAGMTAIPNNMFRMTGLNSARVPDGVTTIGTNAYSYCNGYYGTGDLSENPKLTSVYLSDGVATIMEQAFYADYSLAEVRIPRSVTSIENEAFKNCDDLSTVRVASRDTARVKALFVASGLTQEYVDGLTFIEENPDLWHIEFDAEDGLTPISHIEREPDAALGELPVASKPYCDFVGWFTEVGGNGTQVTSASLATGDATYYAYFEDWDYQVVFIDELNPENNFGLWMNHGNALSATLMFDEDPKCEGYVFNGWFTEDGVKVDLDAPVTAQEYYYARWAKVLDIGLVKVIDGVADATAYSTESALSGDPMTLPAAPAVDGKTFIGWSVSLDSELMSAGAEFVPDDDTDTLYANYERTVWDGNLATLTRDATVESDMTLYGTLAGQYKISIADGVTVTLNNAIITNGLDDSSYSWAGITCLGDTEIVLAPGTVNVVKGFFYEYPGIYVPVGSTLTIGGSGSLTASSNGFGAGIGGGHEIDCGNIVIEGGTISATGGFESAGIGGGSNADCGDITITGGQVTATGGNDAAGIGSGDTGHCGSITISGGTVVATGDSAAGIGTGYAGVCGAISITGGDVTATGGNFSAGIGGGNSGSCGAIAITGGSVTATGDSYAAGIGTGDYTSSCGAITIGADIVRVVATSGYEDAEPIGKGASSSASCGTVTVAPGLYDDHGNPTRTITSASTPPPVWNGDLATLTHDVTVESDMTLYGELVGQYKISIADGVTVTLDGAVITNGVSGSDYSWAGLTCLGDAEIVLAPDSENFVKGFLRDYPGIHVPVGSTLTISGSGSLDASSNGDGAGIGGGDGINCGSIVIEGGVITATGGYESAGIGGGSNTDCGDITITGGQVTATGGSYAAGIGTGDYTSSCGAITITGGSVTATGGTKGSGIGSADDSSSCGAITIGTDIVRVVATRGDEDAEPIGKGAGSSASCGTVTVDPSLSQATSADGNTRTITGASVWDGNLATLTADATAQDGTVIHGTLAGNYKVSIAAGATVTLSNASINASGNLSGAWAGLTCLAGDNLETTIILEGVNNIHSLGADYPGIQVEESTRFRGLNIKGDGELVASASINGRGAGIGGAVGMDNGAIVIESGTVTATGGAGAAGIGSAADRFSNGIVMITGGSVTASGGAGAAGIGCGAGEEAGFAGVTIYGGTVVATGGAGAAGIGKGAQAGDCGDIEVRPYYDGAFRVVATAGAGGVAAIDRSGDGLGVDVDESLFDRTEGSTRTIWRWDGNLAEVYRDTTVTDDTTLYGELPGNYKISIDAGATVVLSNAVINGVNDSACPWAGITCLGDTEIVLAPGTVNVVKGFFYEYPGIYVPVGSTLTIDGSGSLTASSNGFGAGIGAGYGLTGSGVPIPCGNIRIEGGTITAIGGGRCAGIGGGNRGSTCGDIEILGGTITATGGDYGAGIGGGDVGSCGDITIGAGVTRVVATAGAGYGTQPIGGGDEAVSCGDVTVDPSLTDDRGSPTRTITGGGSSSDYAAWATANGVSGAWDAVDANGVANVFRYAFNKPSGAFSEPVLIDITFNAQGRAVILTPPLVNTAGFTFTIGASDNVDGTGNAASYPLNASGETVIDETGKTTRFFRLRAVTQ